MPAQRQPHAVRRGRPGAGVCGSRPRVRAGIHRGDHPPRLHRKPCHHGELGQQRPGHRVDLHPGSIRPAGPLGGAHPCSHQRHQHRPAGDRRGIRRQGAHLHRFRGRRAVQKNRPPGEDRHGPGRGVPSHRPQPGGLHQAEVRRQTGRRFNRRRSASGLRGGRLRRRPGVFGRPVFHVPLQRAKHSSQRLRCHRQQTHHAALPGAGRAPGPVCRGADDGRAGRRAGPGSCRFPHEKPGPDRRPVVAGVSLGPHRHGELAEKGEGAPPLRRAPGGAEPGTRAGLQPVVQHRRGLQRAHASQPGRLCDADDGQPGPQRHPDRIGHAGGGGPGHSGGAGDPGGGGHPLHRLFRAIGGKPHHLRHWRCGVPGGPGGPEADARAGRVAVGDRPRASDRGARGLQQRGGHPVLQRGGGADV